MSPVEDSAASQEPASAVAPSVAAAEREPETTTDRILAAAVPTVVLVLFFGSWLLSWLGVGQPRLEVVTAAVADSGNSAWYINGRVLLLSDGRPVRGRVWAIAIDSAGNRYSPPDTTTDATGRFRLGPIPALLAQDTTRRATDVTVFASATLPDDTAKHLRGEESLRLTRVGRVRWIEPSPAAMGTIGLTFFLTILIGLIQPRPTSLQAMRTKYFTLVVLSFLFTLAMIVLIAGGLRSVNASSSPGDVMSLGFANIYRGTYVKEVTPEWLFSLTAPQPWNPAQVVTGFGVPLWLLLVAVLGAGLFTIALLVKHVKEPVPYSDGVQYRARIEELVRHQFYLLFSPLGAVLVYQLLVVAGIASVQVTVAVVIFAAGAAVNVILDKAVKAVEQLLKS
jgi:hypothetical protein